MYCEGVRVEKDRNVYARSVYFFVYFLAVTVCRGCTELLPSDVVILEAMDNTWHVECFRYVCVCACAPENGGIVRERCFNYKKKS